jgi:hypothetical protein
MRINFSYHKINLRSTIFKITSSHTKRLMVTDSLSLKFKTSQKLFHSFTDLSQQFKASFRFQPHASQVRQLHLDILYR